jgi:hypothetical protein
VARIVAAPVEPMAAVAIAAALERMRAEPVAREPAANRADLKDTAVALPRQSPLFPLLAPHRTGSRSSRGERRVRIAGISS